MSIGKDEILNRWGYHPSTEVTIDKHESVRRCYITFAEYLDEILPDGDAKDEAFKILQQSSMWSNFAIAETAPVVAPPELSGQPPLF